MSERAPMLKVRSELIRQDDITIAQGETPIIDDMSDNDEIPFDLIVQCINFLRSGCPSVQLTREHIYPDRQHALLNNLRSRLGKLKLPSEEFPFDTNGKENTFIVTVTRTKTDPEE